MAARQQPVASARERAERAAVVARELSPVTTSSNPAKALGITIGLTQMTVELLVTALQAIEVLQLRVNSLETAWDNDHPDG